MCDSDSDVMERVISPLPTTLQDVKPENLVCLFQTPLDNTKTGCSITVTLQRCVVLGDDNMEEKRVQVVMERHWPNASAHCTVTTNCSDDDFYFSHQHSPQRNVDSKSFSLPTISSPPSLNTPRGGATLGPGIGSCAFRLPVTPETTRKEEPQHNTFPTNVGDDDDMIVEENKKEPDQLPFSSSPVSPLLSFSTLPEFCPPQSVASLSSEDLSPPDMDYSDQNKDNQEQDEEQELEEECLIRASPCLSPTLAVRVSPSMQEVVDQCVEETVQENIHKDVDTEQVVDEGAPLPVAVSRLQDSPSATSESLMDEHTRLQERQETQGSPQQEQIQEQFQENEQDKEQELHNISTLTSPHVSSSPARGHRQSSPHLVPLSSPPAATAKSHTPSPSPPPPPRVSGVIDNLLWAVLTLTSTTGTDGVDNHTGDMDSSVGSRSRSSSCNSLAELNVHVPDPSSAADS